jgi:hypothetical protein
MSKLRLFDSDSYLKNGSQNDHPAHFILFYFVWGQHVETSVRERVISDFHFKMKWKQDLFSRAVSNNPDDSIIIIWESVERGSLYYTKTFLAKTYVLELTNKGLSSIHDLIIKEFDLSKEDFQIKYDFYSRNEF